MPERENLTVAVCASQKGDIDLPWSHGRSALVEHQAALIRLGMRVRVGSEHLPQRVQERPAEFAHAGEALPELLL
jgi:hypothetical protein